LGAPTSGEVGQGNGVIKQTFENGYIIWNGVDATAYEYETTPPPPPFVRVEPISQSWEHPLPGYRATSEFGERTLNGKKEFHTGIDLGTSGTYPVVEAARSGQVVFAGWNNQGYGNLVIIEHGDGTSTYYAHLSAIDVSVGQQVTDDTPIGNVGNTGNSFGNHLHFEIRVNGVAKNPRQYIQL
jgi:murein DD-endopeptidase MepM/ murein hydrolase activator NlpD